MKTSELTALSPPSSFRSIDMEAINNVAEACQLIDSFVGKPEEFSLPISDEMQDPMGMNMAIITDHILVKGWEPDGFKQMQGFRIHRYKTME